MSSLSSIPAAPVRAAFVFGDYNYLPGESERCEKEGLQCAVCLEPLREPVTHNSCGQMYCSACVSELTNCPQCRGLLKDKIGRNIPRVITNKLNELKVVCSICSKVVERSELRAHIRLCPIECFSGCGEKVAPAQFDSHSLACPAVVVPCDAADVMCDWRGARSALKEHLLSCTYSKLRAFISVLVGRVGTLEANVRQLQQQLQQQQEQLQQELQHQQEHLLHQQARQLDQWGQPQEQQQQARQLPQWGQRQAKQQQQIAALIL